MDFHLKQWAADHHHQDPSSLALPLFSSEPTSNSSSKGMMQSGKLSMGQWQELEVQALIYRHMLTASPIPPQLLHLLLHSNTNSPPYCLSNFPPLYQQTGGGYWGRGGMDAELGRCRRTDGKKWRCSRDVVAGHKYCERHIHRGRNRSRKPVELPTPTTSTAGSGSGSGGDPECSFVKKPTSITTPAASVCGGAPPYTTVGGGGGGRSAFFDRLLVNQRYVP